MPNTPEQNTPNIIKSPDHVYSEVTFENLVNAGQGNRVNPDEAEAEASIQRAKVRLEQARISLAQSNSAAEEILKRYKQPTPIKRLKERLKKILNLSPDPST